MLLERRLAAELERRPDPISGHGPLVALGLVVLFVTIVRNAWISDDALITFRTIENFMAGFGLRWNVDERVQSYTHPLWLLILTPLRAITTELYFTTLGVSIACSLGAAYLVWSRAPNAIAAFPAIAAMLLSKSFVDFSTSGLENPLTHLLLVAFFGLYLRTDVFERRTLTRLALLAALALTNRLDTAALVAPVLLHVALQSRPREVLHAAAWGFSPLVAWTLFSLVYYGFPFPNTAYAKLGAGIPLHQLFAQGVIYGLDLWSRDPVTPVVLTAAFLTPFLGHRRLKAAVVATAILLQCLYILRVGGDFMSGRFFSAPFVVATVLWTTWPWPDPRAPQLGAALLAAVGLSRPGPLSMSPAPVEQPSNSLQIVDERAYYFSDLGLITAERRKLQHRAGRPGKTSSTDPTERPPFRRVEDLLAAGGPGLVGGPDIHYLDLFALSDPLLARLPYDEEAGPWRIGHLLRRVPEGYRETLASGTNQLHDPKLAEFYDQLALITRAPIWSLERFATIVRMNLGHYDHLIDRDAYRTRPTVETDLAAVAKRKNPGYPWDGEGVKIFGRAGIVVRLNQVSHAPTLDLSLDWNDTYEITVFAGTTALEKLVPTRKKKKGSGLAHFIAHLDAATATQGYDRIFVRATKGDGMYSLGHLRLVDAPPDAEAPRPSDVEAPPASPKG